MRVNGSESLCDGDGTVGSVVFAGVGRGDRYSTPFGCDGRYAITLPVGRYRVVLAPRSTESLLYPSDHMVIESLEVR